LESGISSERLDEREAHWISTVNSIAPNGYNVMRHSRCKHREQTTIANHYMATTVKVRICPVKAKGSPKLVYVYLDQSENDPVRFVFGQGTGETYETALEQAQIFAQIFAEEGVEVFEEKADDPFRKYLEKIEQFRGVEIQKIRIAKFNHLVALHIKTADGTTRICFGGKTITQENAYKTAIAIKNKLTETSTNAVVQDDYIEVSNR
jgi:hypothetical protein